MKKITTRTMTAEEIERYGVPAHIKQNSKPSQKSKQDSSMTQEELSRLLTIQKEIDIIKREINNTNAANVPYTVDKVTGSSSSFPYTKIQYKIGGYDLDSYYIKLDRLNKKLTAKLNELMDERDKINDYIETVGDAVIRMILTLKYVNGMTWSQIGNEIGYSSRSVRLKHANFIKRL